MEDAERLVQAKAGGTSNAALRCLTEALYHEARGESVKGQRAVAEVEHPGARFCVAAADLEAHGPALKCARRGTGRRDRALVP